MIPSPIGELDELTEREEVDELEGLEVVVVVTMTMVNDSTSSDELEGLEVTDVSIWLDELVELEGATGSEVVASDGSRERGRRGKERGDRKECTACMTTVFYYKAITISQTPNNAIYMYVHVHHHAKYT